MKSQFGSALKAAWAAAKAPVVAAVTFVRPTVRSCVRGGGFGARAWIARIVGLHDRFGLDREFVERDADLSRSGKSGSIRWVLPEPGYYDDRELQYEAGDATIGQLDDCFVRVDAAGGIYEATKAEVTAAMKLKAAA